jgi:trigger factor
MNCNWTKNENSTGVLTVTVDGEAWKKAQKKAFNKLKSQVDVKGFRHGQVPEALIKARIPQEEMFEYAADYVAQEALEKGIEEFDLKLVARPALHVANANEESITLHFDLTVSPDVKLGDYKSIKVEEEPVEVSEEDINGRIQRVKEQYADWVIREENEPAQNGDTVTIDYTGYKDGVPFEGGAGEGYDLTLGSNTFIPGFEDQLVGIKAGEEREVKVTFPENYAPELAGADAVFKVKAHEVKYKEYPELDDALVAQLKIEGVETAEQYKEKVTEEIRAQKERNAKEKLQNDVIAALVEQSEVTIPEVMIQQEMENQIGQIQQQLSQSGFSLSQYLQAIGQSADDFKATLHAQAESRIKASLVLEAVADAENIVISDEDAEKEQQLMADMYQMPLEQVKQVVSADAIKEDLKQTKALDLLLSNAKSE